MVTLVFNTSTKSIKLFDGNSINGTILLTMNQVPTVKVLEGYYEVRQIDETEKQIPVLRLPIANTIMVIEKH